MLLVLRCDMRFPTLVPDITDAPKGPQSYLDGWQGTAHVAVFQKRLHVHWTVRAKCLRSTEVLSQLKALSSTTM